MVTADYLKRIAVWSRELMSARSRLARAGIVEKIVPGQTNSSVMRGDHFEYWTGVVTGLVRMGSVSRGGKAMSFTGLTAGAWFGEGTVLKNEARRYDVVALRDTRLALMDRAPSSGCYENSVAFNRFLVRSAQRASRPVHRPARIWPDAGCHRAPGALDRVAVQPDPVSGPDPPSGDHAGGNRRAVRHLPAKRQPCLKTLEKEGLLRLEYGGVTILDLERLRSYGE